MPEVSDKLTAKVIEELDQTNECDVRVQIISTFESGESTHFNRFSVLATSARSAKGFFTGDYHVESFVYDAILDRDELFLIEYVIGRTRLFGHTTTLSQGHKRLRLEEVVDFPMSGHLVSIHNGEIVIRHKSLSGCFQSAQIEDGFKVVPDKKMLLWYLLGRVSTNELNILANIYARNKYCT